MFRFAGFARGRRDLLQQSRLAKRRAATAWRNFTRVTLCNAATRDDWLDFAELLGGGAGQSHPVVPIA